MTAYTMLAPHAPELQRAWQTFADPVLYDLATGEVLEYMGTYGTPGGGITHIFRHRCHPQTRQRVRYEVPAAPHWQMPGRTIDGTCA
jgi:hypothetical protein